MEEVIVKFRDPGIYADAYVYQVTSPFNSFVQSNTKREVTIPLNRTWCNSLEGFAATDLMYVNSFS